MKAPFPCGVRSTASQGGEGDILVIECDGSQHCTDEGIEADRIRDDALAQLGLKLLRFDNGQVMGQVDDIVEVVYRYCLHESP